MTLSAYLYFAGQCADAFDFYKDTFKGDFEARMTYRDAPESFNFPPEKADRIMHCTLRIGTSILQGADLAEGFGPPPTPTNAMAVSYKPANRADADRVFALLSADSGAALMDMQETFWGSYFGMAKDRFGVQWLLNLPLDQ